MRRHTLREGLSNGRLPSVRLCEVTLLTTFCICLGSSYAITCHCLDNAQCNQTDSSCSNGCEQGWDGPGCQIGNLAFRKPANQSTTYQNFTAEKAVDGEIPSDESENGCSHTEESNRNVSHWWFVSLSESEDFVIKNITIVNRLGINMAHLNNFYILYTTATIGIPSLTTWKHCTHRTNTQSDSRATFTCNNGTAIGRRVAVYLETVSETETTMNRKLNLCEVMVNGYSYQETSTFQHVNVTVTSSCNNITVTLGNLPVVPSTFLVVHMNASKDLRGSRVERIRNAGARFLTLPTKLNETYSISVAPETCCIGIMCLNDQAASIESSRCILGPSTLPLSLETPEYPRYGIHHVKNFVNVTMLGSSQCRSTDINIQCKEAGNAGSSSLCSNDGACTLDPRHNHTCILRVTYSDGFVDNSTSNISIGTADFSQTNLTVKTTCNTATLLMEKLTKKWDLYPSSIFFTISNTHGNETTVKRILVQETSEDFKAIFDVVQNSTYAVRAFPETCWPTINCSSPLQEMCNSSHECFNGTSTMLKTVQTMPRQYSFKVHECCHSLEILSPTLCEEPRKIDIICSSTENTVNASLSEKPLTVCDLKAGAAYTCRMKLHVANGILDYSDFYFENVNQSECMKLEKSNPSSHSGALMGGTVAGGFVLLILIAVFVVLFRLRAQATKRHTSAENQYTVHDIAVLDMGGAHEETLYGNTTGMGIEEFERYSSNEKVIFNMFSELRANEGQSTQAGIKNSTKNRFKNILPYDFNRVILQNGTNDYINASFINGFKIARKYIATQGPIAGTIADFWKMVWQENVTVIVMLTNYVEQSKKKCEKYFPTASSEQSAITAVVETQTVYDTHTISVLSISSEGQTRSVYHCHFLAWPDKSVPENCGHLLLFCSRVRQMASAGHDQLSPIVVHCSAGVGRTGAFIALDYLLDRFLSERRVDVDSCVLRLRDQRMIMVQTREQYVFLHKALLYGMKTLSFIHDKDELSRFPGRSAELSENNIAAEFQLLQEAESLATSDDVAYTAARSPENFQKSRHKDILACESKRPFLSGSGSGHRGYINAVFCNGCYAKTAFIATQWPLKATIPDFWELVYQQHPSCIVLLHRSPSTEEYPDFFPSPGRSLTAGHFLVTNESIKARSVEGGSECNLNVQLQFKDSMAQAQEEKCLVKMLELQAFDLDSDLPRDLPQTVAIIMQLMTVCKQAKDKPIIVVCKDGATYCGLFLSAINSLQRLLESDEVQVFHTVDLLKASRPQFVRSLEQYKSLYSLLKCFKMQVMSTPD